MSFCWYCHWGWAKSVKDIYDKYSALTDEHTMHYGPAHIVWDDDNFEDRHIEFCLREIMVNRFDYDLTDNEILLIKDSLDELLAIPENIRCDEPEEYDGEHPENFPPLWRDNA